MASEGAMSSSPTTGSKKKSIREPKSIPVGAVGDSSDAAAPLIGTKSHKEVRHKTTKKSVASMGQEAEGGADGQKKLASRRRSHKKVGKGDDPTAEVAEDGSESNTSAPVAQVSSKATGRKSTSSRSSRKAHAAGVQDSDTIGKSAKDQIMPTLVKDQRSIEVKQVTMDGQQEMFKCDMSWPSRLQLTSLMEERTTDTLEALGGAVGLCARLGVNPQTGLPEPIPDFQERLKHFGENRFEEKTLTPFWKFIWEQLAQKIIILLLTMATLEIIIKSIVGDNVERVEAIGESSMLYVTVLIIVFIAAFLDWKRERMFEALMKLLAASNIRFVIRDGRLLQVSDEQICVGDIMSFNSHMAAIISCDGVLLSGQGVKTDESALTGEPEPMPKDSERPFMISGTTVCSGSGSMLVVAVGDYSISGKIKKDVYGAGAAEPSPLYAKLDTMANNIGKAGTVGALIAMIALLVNEYGIRRSNNYKKLMDIFLTTLGILACAIPEGLPLALVIALALTSNKMTRENNLVKSLNSCETMGSATTICTDKTGTLTTNRMTVRGAYIAGVTVRPQGCLSVGPQVASDNQIDDETKTLVGNLICVCTMDESGFTYKEVSAGVPVVCQFQGNPTECALLKLAEDMSFDYRSIRKEVVGRSPDTLGKGCSKSFSSARKMMSWTVQNPAGGYRVYAKGASEIIVSRATTVNLRGVIQPLGTAELAEVNDVISNFADMAMRTIALAYKDIDGITYDELDETVLNSDGSQAFSCEVGLTLLAVVGIEDPLRPEVAPAIARCYNAGIDVRMVTGDNLQTAIAIAKGAGILDLSLHCDKMGSPLPKRAMEGKTFRSMVHDYSSEAIPVFNQEKFDEVWPYLRVLARSSPDDKLTLAKGLNSSLIYKNEKKCKELLDKERIVIFPDRQVVAMTGDGTNDAPALKASDVGFAMGIAGTQIAKDAANIILLDDNFASIVIAAKWGRNVYDSVQKFLQFQLTANASILCLNIFCAVSDMPSPMTVLHLLWLNLIMDSFASIAFASEPATDALLDRPPVNRGNSIITFRMLCNICGASVYNLVVVITFMCIYAWVPDLVPNVGDPTTAAKSRHYTMLFNIFIFLQVFNEYNSRFLYDTPALWRGLDKNPIYLLISFGTITFQIVMVQFAAPILTHPLKIHPDGLTFLQWVICLAAGAGTLINQQLMNGVRVLVNVNLQTRKCEAR